MLKFIIANWAFETSAYLITFSNKMALMVIRHFFSELLLCIKIHDIMRVRVPFSPLRLLSATYFRFLKKQVLTFRGTFNSHRDLTVSINIPQNSTPTVLYHGKSFNEFWYKSYEWYPQPFRTSFLCFTKLSETLLPGCISWWQLISSRWGFVGTVRKILLNF